MWITCTLLSVNLPMAGVGPFIPVDLDLNCGALLNVGAIHSAAMEFGMDFIVGKLITRPPFCGV